MKLMCNILYVVVFIKPQATIAWPAQCIVIHVVIHLLRGYASLPVSTFSIIQPKRENGEWQSPCDMGWCFVPSIA